MSRELILKMSVSVDGFVAGPNGEMDWVFPSMSEEGRQWLIEKFGNVGLLAMGRRAYEEMAAYWLTSTLPLARPMNETPKAVFSKTGVVSPPANLAGIDPETVDGAALEGWLRPTVGGKDLIADIQRLKAENGRPIGALGGASFGASLLAAHLVDELCLVVHPVAIGKGLPLFGMLEAPLHLELEEVKTFDSGVVATTYRPKR